MINIAIFFTKKYIFWLQAEVKVSVTIITHHQLKKHKRSVSPVKGPKSPMRENISPATEHRKLHSERIISLSPMREEQPPVRVTNKTAKNVKARVMTNKKIKDKTKWGNF